jgi:hypothetical protein
MWRSDDEMFDVVRRRAARIQERRRALGTGVAAAAVLVCAAAVAVARGDGGDRQLNVAASGGGSTSASGVERSAFPVPGTLLPPPGVPALPVDAPGQSPAATVPPTVASAPATTIAPGSPGGGGGGEPPPTSVAPAPAGRAEPCSPGDAAAVTIVDKPTYVPGEPVRISGTLRNTSGRSCFSATYGQLMAVTDATGASLWGVGTSSLGACVAAEDCAWPAGAEAAVGGCWDQKDTQAGTQVPVGTYTAKISWTGPVAVTASVTFEIVRDPATPTTTVPTSPCY